MPEETETVDQNSIIICEDKRLSPMLALEAAERAIEENSENAPSGSLEAAKLLGVDPNAKETFGALLTGKKWKNGRVLRVRHLGGDPAIHQKVEDYAKRWEEFANITFEFDQAANAEIRISYHLDNRSWSYLGTDALNIDPSEETMHFGWLTSATTEEEFSRVIVHEFGHALGMTHEHEHPQVQINWNKPVVYQHYMQKLGWTKAAVDQNLFSHYSKEETQFSQYDPESIMHYPIPPQFTTDGKEVGWNRYLSNTDKNFIAGAYPKANPVPGEAFPPEGVSISQPVSEEREYLKAKWG